MSPINDETFEKVERIIQAWEHHAPEASFSGLTLQQFKDATKPSRDVRTNLAESALRTAGLKAERSVVDRNSRVFAERIIGSVRGDAAYGPDSPMWGAMGFVRASERSTGLTRKGIRRQTDEKSETQA